jgi:hypothetical protein
MRGSGRPRARTTELARDVEGLLSQASQDSTGLIDTCHIRFAVVAHMSECNPVRG